jgi:hypothetical protein
LLGSLAFGSLPRTLPSNASKRSQATLVRGTRCLEATLVRGMEAFGNVHIYIYTYVRGTRCFQATLLFGERVASKRCFQATLASVGGSVDRVRGTLPKRSDNGLLGEGFQVKREGLQATLVRGTLPSNASKRVASTLWDNFVSSLSTIELAISISIRQYEITARRYKCRLQHVFCIWFKLVVMDVGFGPDGQDYDQENLVIDSHPYVDMGF